MSEKKENKKGFWATLFAPKQKSSCCCGSQVEEVKEDTQSCGCTPSSAAETTCCGSSSKVEDACCSSGLGKKNIIVLGTGCSSCKALFGTVQEAVAQLGLDATVEKEENLEKIMAYNVMSLPALVVDGKVVAKGQKLSLEQVKELIR